MPHVTRFAPSPTGLLHLGHAYSALYAERAARSEGGRFLLRIEDIDGTRCRPEYTAAIEKDLAWLGLSWEKPVRRQSEHLEEYRHTLWRLQEEDLIYPCFCTRNEIRREIEASAGAPHTAAKGPDGPLYPGTCRDMDLEERGAHLGSGAPFALRLDMERAKERAGGPLTWRERHVGEHVATPELFGDVVLARKDTPTSYHLSVVLDDHVQGVTLVTRGEDLRAATHLHCLLQALLEFEVPEYDFHDLLTGQDGQRLAKRDKAATIQSLREAGRGPAEAIAMTGFMET
ncbi:MAG: tRNA glutamyl-Q(34) synthetase GluQRS [Pseudomonadota bacterium]|nr:tRNA glutamyl-Q(34) synthetase GluQRS [Pseudomonadota bacterium]